MTTVEVHGSVAEGFEAVRAEFVTSAADEAGEAGAQLAVFRHGRPVVDLWFGDEMTADSLTCVYSSTKGAAALVVALLVQDGVVDLDAPIAACWPTFAAAGKSAVTLRDLLTHRSGLIGLDDGCTADELADDAAIAARLAAQRPYWQPGSAIGYGAFTEFAVVAEVVRRSSGRSLPDIYDERIRTPYDLDLYLGLPESEEPRYREIKPGLLIPDELAAFWSNGPGPQSLTGIGYALNSNPPLDQVALANNRRVRALGPASCGGIGSARGLAGLYTAAVHGRNGQPPLLKPDTLGQFTMLHSTGIDLVGGEPKHYSLGFQAKGSQYPFLSAKTFGHNGSAGSEAFADPHSGVTFGYTRRRFSSTWSYPEHDRLAAAVHHAATSS